MPAITEETKYDRLALQQIKKTQNGISKNRMRFRNGHSPKTNSSDELSNIYYPHGRITEPVIIAITHITIPIHVPFPCLAICSG